MKQYELIAPCHFGMEAVLKREIQNLGYEISQEMCIRDRGYGIVDAYRSITDY